MTRLAETYNGEGSYQDNLQKHNLGSPDPKFENPNYASTATAPTQPSPKNSYNIFTIAVITLLIIIIGLQIFSIARSRGKRGSKQ